MSNLEIGFRILLRLARHPASQALAKHALRLGTAQLLRAVHNHSKRMASL